MIRINGTVHCRHLPAVNLHSKDAWVRSAALAALAALARRCGAAEARALLSHAFAEYHGAGGKLSSSEDKIAVLNVRSRSQPQVANEGYRV